VLSEVHLDGILFAPIVVYALVALLITMALRFVLWRIGPLRLVWHLALFEVALYMCVLSLLVILF